MKNQRKILVTSALPYANGAIHLGHMVEHIQTDIWVRFQNHADTNVTTAARTTHTARPSCLPRKTRHHARTTHWKKTHGEHLSDFTGFGIGYDNYYSTHSPENKQYSEQIYLALKANDKIISKTSINCLTPKTNVLARPFCQRRMPQMPRQRPIRRQLRSVRHHLRPHRFNPTLFGGIGRNPVMKETEHFFFLN